MTVLKELLVKIAKQEKLSPLEMEQFTQEATILDRNKESLGKVLKPDGSWLFNTINADVLNTRVPYNRAITYSFIDNSPIAHNTKTDISFSGSRGYIKQADACVIYKPGSTDKWIRNPIVPENRSIITIAEITWDYAAATKYSDLYFDYYDTTDSFDSSYYASATLSAANYTTIVVYAHDTILDGWSVRLSTIQDSGGNLAVQSANMTFFLA